VQPIVQYGWPCSALSQHDYAEEGDVARRRVPGLAYCPAVAATPGPIASLLVVATLLLCACGGDEGCDSIAVATELDVDVSALASAAEVCLDDACVPVRGEVARYRDTDAEPSPIRPRRKTEASLSVLDSDGNVLRADDEVDVPGYYSDGRECGSYAPYGTIVVTSDDIESSDDVFT